MTVYQKAWRESNQQWLKDYRERNREKIKKQSRDRYLRNKKHNDAVRKKWYLENKSRIIKKLRHKKETLSGRICEWKKGAKRRGIEWLLTEEDIKSLPLVCHYTGTSLVMEVGHSNTISIDRVDSAKPYSLENVVMCCSMINIMKSTFDRTEFIKTCKQIATYEQSRS
jgi:hypothetical protein